MNAHVQFQKLHDPGPSLRMMQGVLANDTARLAKVMLQDAKYAEAHVAILKSRRDEMAKITRMLCRAGQPAISKVWSKMKIFRAKYRISINYFAFLFDFLIVKLNNYANSDS